MEPNHPYPEGTLVIGILGHHTGPYRVVKVKPLEKPDPNSPEAKWYYSLVSEDKWQEGQRSANAGMKDTNIIWTIDCIALYEQLRTEDP